MPTVVDARLAGVVTGEPASLLVGSTPVHHTEMRRFGSGWRMSQVVPGAAWSCYPAETGGTQSTPASAGTAP